MSWRCRRSSALRLTHALRAQTHALRPPACLCSQYGWIGCSSGSEPPSGSGSNQEYQWLPEWDIDYGEPTGVCSETQPGKSAVFTRSWSKADVKFDCNTMTPTINTH